MPQMFQRELSDAEFAAVEAHVGAGNGMAWLLANFNHHVEFCAKAVEARRLASAGINSVSDLTQAELDPIVAARLAARGSA